MLPSPTHVVVIQYDEGGMVADFSARVSTYLKRRVSVRIEGLCASSCTMLAALPPKRLCVGPDAKLAFHASFFQDPRDPNGKIAAPQGDLTLMTHYPNRLQTWIASKGGLTNELIVLKGEELRSLFRICPYQGRRTAGKDQAPDR